VTNTAAYYSEVKITREKSVMVSARGLSSALQEVKTWRHNIKHKDTHYNDTQHYGLVCDTQHKDSQQNIT
jgi:hypothetical protein